MFTEAGVFLITHDLLGGEERDSPVKEIHCLFRKLRRIHTALMFKYEELKSLDTEEKNKNLINALEQFALIGIFQIHS